MSNTFEILAYVGAIAFPLFALLDIYRRRGAFNFDLLVWVFAVVLIPFLGTVLYYLIGTKKLR